MAYVTEVLTVEFVRYHQGSCERVLIVATGAVASPGWAELRLAPRYGPHPPEDGIWDFDFLGFEPLAPQVDAVVPVSAHAVHSVPPWFRGVRVFSAERSQLTTAGRFGSVHPPFTDRPSAHALVAPRVTLEESLAACWTDWIAREGSGERARRHHRLLLRVEGPDRPPLLPALDATETASLLASLARAYASDEPALDALVGRLLEMLEARLGSQYHCRVDDRREWIRERG